MPTARKTTTTKPAGADTASGEGEGVAAPDAPASAPASTWERLAAPFPSEHIEKLPKALKARDDDKGRCVEGTRYTADGHACGGWHARAVHLDYVGHAGITMRLNDVLGPGGWDFTPYAETPEGLPSITASVFYARLTITVDGEAVTKWDMAANYNGPQEAYGDALRRCAMRFGVGTYLWSKSEAAANLAASADVPPPREPDQRPAEAQGPGSQEVTYTPAQVQVNNVVASLTDDERTTLHAWAVENRVPAPHQLTDKQAANLLEYLEWLVGQRGQRADDSAPWPDETPHDATSPN